MVDMIDCAVAFLGPDLDLLAEHMKDLGQRHVAYGVKPDYFAHMGKAVIFTLAEMLGTRFSLDNVNEWTVIFQFMTSKMIIGMKT